MKEVLVLLISKRATRLFLQNGLRQFQKEDNALWRNVMLYKHGSSHFGRRISHQKSPRPKTLGSILIINSNITIKVGNGKGTSFWEDKWRG